MHNAVAHHPLTDAQPGPQQPLPCPAPPVLLSKMTPHGMGYSFGQLGSPVPVLSPPSSRCTPAPLLAGQHGKLNNPWLCVSDALQQLKHRCAISIILILHVKHNAMPGTRKKMTSIPSKTYPSQNIIRENTSWEIQHILAGWSSEIYLVLEKMMSSITLWVIWTACKDVRLSLVTESPESKCQLSIK